MMGLCEVEITFMDGTVKKITCDFVSASDGILHVHYPRDELLQVDVPLQNFPLQHIRTWTVRR